MPPARSEAAPSCLEHLHADVTIYAACRDEFLHWYELIRPVCLRQRAGPHDYAASAYRVKVHEIASAFEPKRPTSGTISAARINTGGNDWMIRRRLSRTSCCWVVADHLCAKPKAHRERAHKARDLPLHFLLILTRDHAPVEEKIAAIRHDVIGQTRGRS